MIRATFPTAVSAAGVVGYFAFSNSPSIAISTTTFTTMLVMQYIDTSQNGVPGPYTTAVRLAVQAAGGTVYMGLVSGAGTISLREVGV